MDYGLLSLVPPLVAIALAIALRQVIVPLLLAILAGAMILSGIEHGIGPFLRDTAVGFVTAIWNSVGEYDHVRALIFSLAMGAMVGVLEVGGGAGSSRRTDVDHQPRSGDLLR